MQTLTFWQKIIIFAIPLIFAITVHETAHGWVAYKLGDPSAKNAKRLTLNPIRHIDLFGTLIIPAILLYSTSFLFGWAKPVPVDFGRLKKPRRDMPLVALAGPVSNLLMAILWAFIAKITILIATPSSSIASSIVIMSYGGIFINCALMILNLIPIPPLDGSRVFIAMLSPSAARTVFQYEILGLFLLAGLLISGKLTPVLIPILFGAFHFIRTLIGV